jgi:hypothetical protein
LSCSNVSCCVDGSFRNFGCLPRAGTGV